MTEREVKRLSRAELLEMLLTQSKEVESLQQQLVAAGEKLYQRELLLETSGSIAEAALRLNGVFEAADAAAAQYLENIARPGGGGPGKGRPPPGRRTGPVRGEAPRSGGTASGVDFTGERRGKTNSRRGPENDI